MTESAVRDVSDTALWVAVYRAREHERPDALFRDPLAERLAGDRGRRIAAGIKGGHLVEWAVVLRTCIIDRLLSEAIARGVDTVLNLGAGLDTRPYRMTLPTALRWIEVDYPHLLAHKEEQLGGAAPVCRLERIGLDLSDRPARRELFARIGADASRVLILTEGVTPYLSNDEVGSLADDLRQPRPFREWVLDYIAAGALRQSRQRRISRQLPNAPFLFRPPDWEEFFREHRWIVKEFCFFADEADRQKRPCPLSWRLKLLWLFLSRQRRQALRRMAGFTLLVPGEHTLPS